MLYVGLLCYDLISNFIHHQVIEKKKQTKKQYTIDTKMQSICQIIKQSLMCSLHNKL